MDPLKMSGPTCGLRTDADTLKGCVRKCPLRKFRPMVDASGQSADMSTASTMSAMSAMGSASCGSRDHRPGRDTAGQMSRYVPVCPADGGGHRLLLVSPRPDRTARSR